MRTLLPIALMLAACPPQPVVREAKKPIVVGTYDAVTNQVTGVNSEAVPRTFKDGTGVSKVDVIKAPVGFLLYRWGRRTSGDSLVDATELTASDGKLLLMAGKTSYSCTGNPCSQCAFKDKDRPQDGCECKESSGTAFRCNHSVSTSE